MFIRELTWDHIDGWLELAAEVEPLFKGPMVENIEFHRFIGSKVQKSEAHGVFEDQHDGALMGIIAFSPAHNCISWLAVFERYHGRGAGSMLVESALNRLDRTKEIAVMTFNDGDEEGKPARHVFEKFGFVEADSAARDDMGNPRSVMKLYPDAAARHESAG
jgi:GNAT superfamily N-acetyltransferase